MGILASNPYVFTGPTFSLALLREIRVLGAFSKPSSTVSTSSISVLPSVWEPNLSLQKNFRGFVNLRYSLGLVDLQKDGDQYYTRGIELTAGVITVL
ncbi:MAG: hypothetical protein R3B54_10765 [Bdellovibrionota bacterium]